MISKPLTWRPSGASSSQTLASSPYTTFSSSDLPSSLVAQYSSPYLSTNAVACSMPYATTSSDHMTPTTLAPTPDTPSYSYSVPSSSQSCPATLPKLMPSMRSEYYAEEDLSPFGVGYAAIQSTTMQGSESSDTAPLPSAPVYNGATWASPVFDSYQYMCSSGYASPPPLPADGQDPSAPPSGPGIVRTRASSNTSFINQHWARESRFPWTSTETPQSRSNDEHGTRKSANETAANASQGLYISVGETTPSMHPEPDASPRSAAADAKPSLPLHESGTVLQTPGAQSGAGDSSAVSESRDTIQGPPSDSGRPCKATRRQSAFHAFRKRPVGGQASNGDRFILNESDSGKKVNNTSMNTVNYTRTGRVSKAKKGFKVYDCECGRSYSRAEHLQRHQRNHAQEGGTVCSFPMCGKIFFRPDLLARHEERQ